MLTLDPQSVYFIVVKAHAFDAKMPSADPEPGNRSSDEDQSEGFVEDESDASYDEVKTFIESLNEDEQIDLVALTWVGRGDFTGDEWQDARAQALASRSDHTADYLLGIPVLGDYLEEGLEQLGYASEGYGLGRP